MLGLGCEALRLLEPGAGLAVGLIDGLLLAGLEFGELGDGDCAIGFPELPKNFLPTNQSPPPSSPRVISIVNNKAGRSFFPFVI
jgi:hypothetical protein